MRKSIIGVLCSLSIALISSPLYAKTYSHQHTSTTWEEKAEWCKNHPKQCKAKHKHKHHHHHKHHKHHHHKHHKHHQHHHYNRQQRPQSYGSVHEQDSYCSRHPAQCAKEIEFNEETREHR